MKESRYQTKVLKHLRDRGVYCENIFANGYMAAGIPDIVGCYRGVFVAFELKVGKNRPSKLQKAKVNLINSIGGYAIVPYDTFEPIDELLDYIDEQLVNLGIDQLNTTAFWNYEGGTR